MKRKPVVGERNKWGWWVNFPQEPLYLLRSSKGLSSNHDGASWALGDSPSALRPTCLHPGSRPVLLVLRIGCLKNSAANRCQVLNSWSFTGPQEVNPFWRSHEEDPIKILLKWDVWWCLHGMDVKIVYDPFYRRPQFQQTSDPWVSLWWFAFRRASPIGSSVRPGGLEPRSMPVRLGAFESWKKLQICSWVLGITQPPRWLEFRKPFWNKNAQLSTVFHKSAGESMDEDQEDGIRSFDCWKSSWKNYHPWTLHFPKQVDVLGWGVGMAKELFWASLSSSFKTQTPGALGERRWGRVLEGFQHGRLRQVFT